MTVTGSVVVPEERTLVLPVTGSKAVVSGSVLGGRALSLTGSGTREPMSAGLANVVSARGFVPSGAVADGTGRMLKLSPLLVVSGAASTCEEEGICVGGELAFASAARAAAKPPAAVASAPVPKTFVSADSSTFPGMEGTTAPGTGSSSVALT